MFVHPYNAFPPKVMFSHSLSARFVSTFIHSLIPFHSLQNLLYTGLRNGGILRFDTRLQRLNSHPLFDSISEPTTSITNLKHLLDHQLLVSFIDGRASSAMSHCRGAAKGRIQISTFDLRFPVRTPLATFTGHFNKYTIRLVSHCFGLPSSFVLDDLPLAAGY